MGSRQDRVVKRWTKAEMGQLLVEAWELVFGGEPTRTEAENLLAMLWLENGGNVVNNNFGNISAAGFYDGKERFITQSDYWRPPWFGDEREFLSGEYDALHARMLNGTAPSAFKSYSVPIAGMQDFLGLLKRRYPGILSAARAGDMPALANAIREERYNIDLRAEHAESMQSIRSDISEAGIFSGLAGRKTRPGIGFGLLGLLGGAVWYVGRRKRR